MDNFKEETFESGAETALESKPTPGVPDPGLLPVAGDPGDEEDEGNQQGRFCCKGNQKKFVNGPCPPGWHQCNQ
ncbi:hypothetical protein MTO98_26060 [Mucilaginibacter sp. SMC90]|uniref:hypothetical protein n=1 Tax=Mucilaginibacter sp. SMC90 TaxID=2929803 RepID=UPI001FB37C94|nr:hypothetical protein [Mucilaginibacter sp. SMC90]UOE47879.1 hypothetical protein MTO98_26060 [Mucilaginibacter sp. SMC90]